MAYPQIPSINEPMLPDGTPQPMNARGQTVASSGAAIEGLGAQFGNIADTLNKVEVQKAQAGQDMWLSQAKSAAELNAQKMTDDAQRSAQPGQPILPQVQEAWQKHMDEQLDTVDNPVLKAKYSAVLGDIGNSTLKASQAFDYTQADAYTTHNLQQTVNNKSALYNTMRDRDAITTKAQQDLGELTANINALPLPPDKRLELLDSTRKGIVLSALDAKTAIDPQASLNENAPARSPDARLNDPNQPRGIRNNNPGNLEGDQGFQGFKSLDEKGYATFETPEAGLRAMAINLRNQQDLHGLNTVEGIVTKYAPASDGNNTPAYIQTVSDAMGVKPTDPLDLHDPGTLAKLMQATIKQENGVNPYGAKNIMHAATAAAQPGTEGPDPTMTRPDGGARTGDPLFALLKPEEQQTQINHMEAVYRQQQYFQRAGAAQAGAMLGQMQQSHQVGVAVDDDQIKELQSLAMDAKSPNLQNRVAEFVVKNDAIKEFTPMSPLEIQQTLNAAQPLIASGKATPSQIQRYQVGQQLLQTITTQAKTDPLTTFSRSSGQPVPPVETASPDAFQARGQYAAAAQHIYGTAYKAFTPVEAPRIAESFSTAPPESQRAFLTNFAKGFGTNTADAADQVWGKQAPQISYAASMLALPNVSNAQAKTAMDIVAGSQRMRDDKDAAISTLAVDQYLASNHYDQALSPIAYDKVLAASKAAYAGRYSPSFKAAPGDIDAVVRDVVGGELTSIHGSKIITPAGVDGDTFEKFVKNITPAQISDGMVKAQTTLNGGVAPEKPPAFPQNKNGRFDPENDKLRLVTLGNGFYQMIDKNGAPYPAPEMLGGTAKLQFDPSDIIRPPIKGIPSAGIPVGAMFGGL